MPANNNYAPPKSTVADITSSDESAEKATRGARFGASFIDGLLFGLPFLPSYLAAIPTVMHQGRPGMPAMWGAVAATGGRFYFALIAVLCIGAVTAALVYKNGQTIGKKLLNIKVVRKDGSRASFGRIFGLRYLLNSLIGFIPLLGGLYALVDVLFIFGAEKRCCHDYIADTIVVQA
jgi:uncharacterized RDD family membrane protein YckC